MQPLRSRRRAGSCRSGCSGWRGRRCACAASTRRAARRRRRCRSRSGAVDRRGARPTWPRSGTSGSRARCTAPRRPARHRRGSAARSARPSRRRRRCARGRGRSAGRSPRAARRRRRRDSGAGRPRRPAIGRDGARARARARSRWRTSLIGSVGPASRLAADIGRDRRGCRDAACGVRHVHRACRLASRRAAAVAVGRAPAAERHRVAADRRSDRRRRRRDLLLERPPASRGSPARHRSGDLDQLRRRVGARRPSARGLRPESRPASGPQLQRRFRRAAADIAHRSRCTQQAAVVAGRLQARAADDQARRAARRRSRRRRTAGARRPAALAAVARPAPRHQGSSASSCGIGSTPTCARAVGHGAQHRGRRAHRRRISGVSAPKWSRARSRRCCGRRAAQTATANGPCRRDRRRDASRARSAPARPAEAPLMAGRPAGAGSAASRPGRNGRRRLAPWPGARSAATTSARRISRSCSASSISSISAAQLGRCEALAAGIEGWHRSGRIGANADSQARVRGKQRRH